MKYQMNGRHFAINNNIVSWSNCWADIYKLTEMGYFTTSYGGLNTFGHTDFIPTKKFYEDFQQPPVGITQKIWYMDFKFYNGMHPDYR